MRVLHFVTGGFSGATQVAVDLCLAAQQGQDMQVLLVLRRKRNTDAARVQALRDKGLDVRVVPGWSHLATVLSLRKIALEWQPDILVAHGFSDHLWGRYAGILAKVPHLVHVEHNSRERYTAWRLKQALWLARYTAVSIGVSEGVKARLLELGFPAERCVAIPNGIDMQRFPKQDLLPWDQRQPALVMAARFARQKDHETLLHALALLAQQGLKPTLYLAGGGKQRQQQRARTLATKLGIADQVQFLGQVQDLPQFLMQQQIFVLSTHYEGMPLALLEGMAAGCACIGSNVVGVREVLEHGRTGLLVAEGDASAMAEAIHGLLNNPVQAQHLALAARQQAETEFDLSVMQARHASLLRAVQSGKALTMSFTPCHPE